MVKHMRSIVPSSAYKSYEEPLDALHGRTSRHLPCNSSPVRASFGLDGRVGPRRGGRARRPGLPRLRPRQRRLAVPFDPRRPEVGDGGHPRRLPRTCGRWSSPSSSGTTARRSSSPGDPQPTLPRRPADRQARADHRVEPPGVARGRIVTKRSPGTRTSCSPASASARCATRCRPRTPTCSSTTSAATQPELLKGFNRQFVTGGHRGHDLRRGRPAEGLAVNSYASISLEPPLVLVSVQKHLVHLRHAVRVHPPGHQHPQRGPARHRRPVQPVGRGQVRRELAWHAGPAGKPIDRQLRGGPRSGSRENGSRRRPTPSSSAGSARGDRRRRPDLPRREVLPQGAAPAALTPNH